MKTSTIVKLASLVALVAAAPSRGDSILAVTQDNGMNRPLGNGYDTRKESLRAQCVEGESSSKEPDGSVTQGTIALKVESDEHEVASKFGLDVGGKARIGVAQYSAGAQFLNESSSKGLSISYNYTAEFMRNSYLVNSAAHPVVPRPGMDGYLGPDQAINWYLNCGDEYVHAQDTGARLMVSLRFDFVSRDERSRFAAQFGVEAPLFSASASVEQASHNYSKNTQLTVNALQIGGDPAKLGSIFCPIEPGAPGSSSCLADARKTINCSFGDLGPCMEIMAQMVAYGNGQDPDSFGGQVKDYAHYNPLKLYTQPWTYLGSKFPLPPPKESIQNWEANLAILSGLFEEAYANWGLSYRYSRGKAPRLSQGDMRQKERMSILAGRFKENMSYLAKAIEDCYATPGACEARVAAAQVSIGYGTADYPGEKQIEALLVPETYAQYCDIASSSDKLKNTIARLNEKARVVSDTLPESWNTGDVCFKGQQALEKLEELDLSSSDIADLRPIGTLTQLKRLNLSLNRITDATELSKLSQLEELNLNDNRISDVVPLAKLYALQRLSLQNNRAVDVSPLSSLTSLDALDLRRNEPALKCPLANAGHCRTEDFAGLSSFQSVDRLGSYYEPRVGMAGAALSDGRLFISGGLTTQEGRTFVEVLDPSTLILKQLTPMKTARTQHTVTPLPGGCKLLIAGGRVGNLDTVASASLGEVYDVCASTGATQGASQPVALRYSRTNHTATVLGDGRVLLAGGWTRGHQASDERIDATPTAEIYDPVTGTSHEVGSMSVPRAEHAAIRLPDGKVLVSGGYTQNSSIRTLEIFDPATETFRFLPISMASGRSDHSMTALPDGTVLIAGGFGTDNLAVSLAEVFDPRTGTITAKMPLELARGGHRAVPLQNGKVLVLGGTASRQGGVSNRFDSNGTSFAQAELFDPLTRTFSPLSPMAYGRSYPIAISLPGSRVVVLGGMGSEDAAITLELFEYSRMP